MPVPDINSFLKHFILTVLSNLLKKGRQHDEKGLSKPFNTPGHLTYLCTPVQVSYSYLLLIVVAKPARHYAHDFETVGLLILCKSKLNKLFSRIHA
jgi:hypothetical protein